MTNHSARKRTFVHHEISVPIRDGQVTRRDVVDLLVFADRKYRELHPDDPHIADDQMLYDDAYMIEPRDDELVAVIKIEQQ